MLSKLDLDPKCQGHNNNRVMCQMSMKLPAMFDQNPPHTFDKIVKKLINTKNALKA